MAGPPPFLHPRFRPSFVDVLTELCCGCVLSFILCRRGGGAHHRRLCFVGVLTEGGFGSVCFIVHLWSSDGREWRGVYAGAPCGKLNAGPFLEGMILVGGYSNVGAPSMNESGSLACLGGRGGGRMNGIGGAVDGNWW